VVVVELELKVFFTYKTISTLFDLKHLENTVETLINLFMALKKPKKPSEDPKLT
jgi:hypothetical protein